MPIMLPRIVLLTWLIILPLHIILIDLKMALSMPYLGSGFYSRLFDRELLSIISLFSTVFSMPGAFALLLSTWLAKAFIYDSRTRFVFVCGGAASSIIICYLLLELTINTGLTIGQWMPFIVVSIATVLAALCLTRKKYYSYFNSVS